MKIELTKSQISYLKSLDSKKKKRKFLLDCFVEDIEVWSELEELIQKVNKKAKESQELIEKSNEVAKLPTDFCVEITQSNKEVLEKLWNQFFNKVGVSFCEGYLHSNSLCDFFDISLSSRNLPIVTTDEFLKYIGREDLIERKSVKISDLTSKETLFEKLRKGEIELSDVCNALSLKPNYSPEEIELVKHNINQREVSEQGSELLKFDMLGKSKKSFFLNKEQIEDSKEKEQKVYKYMFYSLVELKQDKIDEIIEFITENNQNAN